MWRTGQMKFIRRWKIQNQLGEEIRMPSWLLASTLHADKRINLVQWKVSCFWSIVILWMLHLVVDCVVDCFVIIYISEICSVANGASKKEVGRAKEFIVKQLEEEMGKSMEMGTIHAGDFLVCEFVFSYCCKPNLFSLFLFLRFVNWKECELFWFCLHKHVAMRWVLWNSKYFVFIFFNPQRRFCSHLGMTHQAIKAATEAVKKSEELDIRYFAITLLFV